ncbi:DUF7511 domain-containing protein [Halobiforma nitratireducens]|uniref:DUF7511 domain-containing protein n=1 Tax=Halobiforma nitratireducens JCM 10879 TaxID=1227454 RepID=M0M3F1_9EURY|nr:hypothetical protein [Halobiforma nitratireducens]EMA40226.1 hypothetical protein C446_07372 [Halobiforma nitratireducens JCM 10879]
MARKNENNGNPDSNPGRDPDTDSNRDLPARTERQVDPDEPGGVRPPLESNPGIELDHAHVENDDAPDECALFPRAASEDELVTNWIVAHEGSFVELESVR